MRLSLGFSTCPNDTFIFDALVHNRVDKEGLDFEIRLADVEELNRSAFDGTIDMTKISYHAFAFLTDKYQLLNSGSALGFGNGPLLISKHKIYKDEVGGLKIAIPGKNTTANLLLSIAFPEAQKKKEYLFSDIEEVVLSGEAEAGLIIHENRFTYAEKGLQKIMDLGEYWEQQTNLPIPLGGIIVNRNLAFEVRNKVARVLRRSVDYALQNPNDSLPFIRKYAQTMDEKVMRNHIQLYVNDYTLDLGENGRKAIETLYAKGTELKLFDPVQKDIFVSG